MTCAILLSVPPSATPHHRPLFSQRAWFFSGMKWSQVPTTAAPIPSDLTKYPSNLIPLCSPSSTPLVEESSVEDSASVLPHPTNASLRGCKACGKEEIEKNCNGEGRIQGGIATVPGFGWWPIKAYRPCPGFLASGGRYRRRGQTMDEVTSGVGKREPSVRTVNEVKQIKKE